jgi:hypothetical protein
MGDGAKLAVVQSLERAMPVPQLLMRSYLHDHPILEYDDLVCTPDRRQSMSYDECRSAFLQPLQRFQQLRLRLRIQRTRRFISVASPSMVSIYVPLH